MAEPLKNMAVAASLLLNFVLPNCVAGRDLRTFGDTTRLNFKQCFSSVDTTKSKEAIGCYNSFYKIINKQYVLKIAVFKMPLLGQCLQLISSNQAPFFRATISVYQPGKANLDNVCSDVVIVNTLKPIINKNTSTGNIIVGVSNPTDYYGRTFNKVSILVKRLVFYDKKTGKTIEIKNELFWKVLNDLSEQG